MTKQLTWLITGCASGFGQEFVLQLLARGDNVIATSRFLSEVEAFQEKGASIMELDVTWTQSMLNAKAEETIAIHSFIDVLVNNAGYGLLGTMEDLTHEQLLEQLNTNTFGAINVTRAFLPHYRERKAGTVVFMGSLNGTEGEGMSDAYCTSKFALRD
jgi:NAD(P)-dependent dehydrogenase (short-subunit alcohol dehydrogenase family)